MSKAWIIKKLEFPLQIFAREQPGARALGGRQKRLDFPFLLLLRIEKTAKGGTLWRRDWR